MQLFNFFLILLGTMMTTLTPSHCTNQKVIIIGAGIAGLTAAYRLAEQGIDVHLYEAKNRVGGRILTALVDGHIAELGAQSISDGGPAKNMLRLVNELGLSLYHSKISFDPHYVHDGQLIRLDQLLSAYNFDEKELTKLLPKLAQTSKNMRDILDHFFDAETPAHKILSSMLANYEGAAPENLSAQYWQTLLHMLLGGVCSAHSFEQSGAEHLYDHLSLAGGNSTLPEALAQKLDDRIHLNMPLQAVGKTAAGAYLLSFLDGQTIEADVLVLANPCSTYKNINIQTDVIPNERLAAIRQVHYGANAKIIVPLTGDYEKRIQTLDDEINTHFNADETVLTLYCSRESGFYTSKNIAAFYLSKLPHVKLVFNDEHLPQADPIIAEDKSFVQYHGPVGHSWPQDPYIQGSYHYVAPGQEEVLTAQHEHNGELVIRLFAPIDNSLYFAGEHASILDDVPGTMEAACESGERTARMILKLF